MVYSTILSPKQRETEFVLSFLSLEDKDYLHNQRVWKQVASDGMQGKMISPL